MQEGLLQVSPSHAAATLRRRLRAQAVLEHVANKSGFRVLCKAAQNKSAL